MASLPVLNVRHRLFAFANVHYKFGAALTSNFEAVVPAELGRTKATDKRSMMVGDFSRGLDGFATHSTATDPAVFLLGAVRARGPGGRTGIRQNLWQAIFTHKVGDPKWQAPVGAELHIDVYGPQACVLTITCHKDEGYSDACRFEAQVPLRAGKGWRTLKLSSMRFAATSGERPQPLKSWRKLPAVPKLKSWWFARNRSRWTCSL